MYTHHQSLIGGKIKRMIWVCRTYEMRNAYKVLVGKPVGKGPLGRPRRRWLAIKMDLGEI
jgi:hypothetical protein